MAGQVGIEPTLNVSETFVLPLHYRPNKMAVSEGFEPPGLLHPHAFQACALDRSANSPKWRKRRESDSQQPLLTVTVFETAGLANVPTFPNGWSGWNRTIT